MGEDSRWFSRERKKKKKKKKNLKIKKIAYVCLIKLIS